MNDYYYYYLMEILDQILFWTEISKEHPIVVNTFAKLTNKDIEASLVTEVKAYSEVFQNIQSRAKTLRGALEKSVNKYDSATITQEIKRIIQDFSIEDENWIETLQKVAVYGKDDTIWQTLLQHITEEQIYASNLMRKYYLNLD